MNMLESSQVEALMNGTLLRIHLTLHVLRFPTKALLSPPHPLISTLKVNLVALFFHQTEASHSLHFSPSRYIFSYEF